MPWARLLAAPMSSSMIGAEPAMRHALWITRFDWVDEDDLAGIVTMAIKVGVTDVLMQVRGAGDALYLSDVAPASAKIAGRLGWEPRWDPLGVVCDIAGRHRDVRVHAWVNALSGWPAGSREGCSGLEPSPDGAPDHLLIRNPEAVLVDADGEPMPCPNPTDYVWVSAEHRAVVDELRVVADELVSRYPLAGIHLDRIRYPLEGWFDPPDRTRRPDAITALVRAVRGQLPQQLDVTASIMPDYGSIADGVPEHLAIYGQDGWAWAADGLVSSVMPMVYTDIAAGEAWSWSRLMRQHLDNLPTGQCWVPIYAEHDEAMIRRQAGLAQQEPVAGIAWYSAGLVRTRDKWNILARIREQDSHR